MKKAAGFITLHRQILDWEWYRHPHTAFLFIHLLLSANFVDGVFQGRVIKRGQLVTSVPQLSTCTGLSIQQTKTALAHLRLTGEITDEANHQYRIITIVKYDDFQKLTYKNANDQPTTNLQNIQRLTYESSNDQPQYNNNNNINKEIHETINHKGEERTAKRFTPPTREDIIAFCLENGLIIDVDRFIDYYTSNGWMVGRNHMKDWKATVRNWAKGDNNRSTRPAPAKRVIAQEFPQRDYSSVNDDMMSGLAAEIEQAKKDGVI